MTAEIKREIDMKAWDGRFISQQEANYVPLSSTPGQACANCRWFSAAYDACMIIESYPQPILATGHSNRWEANPSDNTIYEPDPLAVYIVDPPYEDDDTAEMSLPVPKSMITQVKEFIGNLGKQNKPQSFAVFKTANGKMGWVSRHTGKWIDRENEILAERSHEAYVNRVQSSKVSPPELWMWHNSGTKHGQAITVWKSGGFVLAAGLIDDTSEGESIFRYYEKNSGKIKLSHMFHYPSVAKIDGVYHEYNTVEITTLPDGAEAFPYTNFEEINTMALPDIAKNMILEAGGQAMLDRALAADSKAIQDTAKLDAMGIASKNYHNYDGSEFVLTAEKAQIIAQAQTDMETRLKTAETSLESVLKLNDTIKSLQDAIKTLTDELEATKTREAIALDSMRDMQSKLALFTDLKPPASQSSETLLNDREKTLVDRMSETAKLADQPSLIDSLIGGSPAISTVNGG